MSSEIIRRLDDHHAQSVSNIEFVKGRAEQVSQKAQEIKDFLEELNTKKTSEHDIAEFLKTKKLQS